MSTLGVITFECQKCGTCCRNLLEDVDGITNGLFLTQRERELFPSELISPKLAIGVGKPRRVIAYQLNINVCPHLDEKHECRIYDRRPLACQSFPFEYMIYSGPTVSVKCPVIGSRMKKGEQREVEVSEVEVGASEKMNRYIINRSRKYRKKGLSMWNYDLETKLWVRCETIG